MTIARRLTVLLAVPLVALVGFGVFTRMQLAEIEARSRFVAESRIGALATLGNLSRGFAELRVNMRSHLLALNDTQRAAARALFDEDEADVRRLLDVYADHLMLDDQDRRLLGDYRALSREWIAGARQVMALADAGRGAAALSVFNGGVSELGVRLSHVSNEWIAHDQDAATNAGAESVAVIERFRRDMFIANTLAFLLTSVLGVLTLRRIVTPIRALETSVQTIAEGQYEKAVPFTAMNDETGSLARSIDVLKQGAAAMDQQRWVKSQVSQLTSVLQSAASIDEFGDRLLAGLVPLLGGGVAAFYRFDEAAGALQRVATYGLDPGAGASTIRPGEGLAGQCAKERAALTLTEVPPDYVRISSAVGQSSPLRVTALPVASKDGLLGVLEVASFRPFSTAEQALLDELLPLAGLTLDILQRNAALVVAKGKAEEAAEMKAMFLANMSHEIRTPMNAIIGLSHLALKTPLSAKQQDYVSKIHNAGTSLLSIINDILDFSKIDAGRLDIETTDFSLDDVIGGVTTLTAQKAHEKGLEFVAHVAPDVPDRLAGDPVRIGQILTNCVNNAVKFTERGEIHVKVESVARTGEKVQLKFSVRDTGIGMTPEQSARLFQPFTQADMSTTRKHGGTGLGLSISRRLVELMGGRIWLETEPGAGTTFYFTLWLGVGQAHGAAKEIPGTLGRLRVLVADDSPAACEILRDAVHAIVARVDVVGSGSEAVAAVRQQDAAAPYDLVFMDWRMPGMDGLEASRQIKADETLRHRPAIVLVTAFGRDEVREDAERLQLEGFLVKPVTRSTIVDTLVDLFGRRSQKAPAPSPEPPARLTGVRVLVAEDNEINQQIAHELLDAAGATVTIVGNGRQAVDLLSTGAQPAAFDVVLMDVQMPEMDGYQATAALRADGRFATLPILAMTAHATPEERQRCLAAGMNDHIAKPIDPAGLVDTVERFVRRDELRAIAGLDSKDGLARVGGNRALYLKLLRQFVDGEGGDVVAIEQALTKGDAFEAERLAHSLKGVAGNIGARQVQSAAGDVERVIRDQGGAKFLQAAIHQLAAALDPLVRAIRTAVVPAAARPTASDGAGSPASPAKSRDVAAQLASLLADLNPAAAEFVDAHRSSLRPLFDGAGWIAFEKLVQSYAFPDAHARLEEALRLFIPGEAVP